jgi:hypothetical protein
MKEWIKAAGIACLVEIFPVLVLAATGRANSEKLISRLLTGYHMFSISFAFTVLNIIWSWPGPGRESIRTSGALTYFLVYAFQVLLTTPIIYGLLRGIDRVRKRAKGNIQSTR